MNLIYTISDVIKNPIVLGKRKSWEIEIYEKSAFDRVEWSFLKQVMLKMGFDPIFVNWIYTCISSASFSFNINGNARGYIFPSRGIWQGDPLSPYLFLIWSEVFLLLIQNFARTGDFHGLKLSKNGPTFSHLLFTDDSLVFCKANLAHADCIKRILDLYGSSSGQLVNLEKSSNMFSKNTP